MTQEVTSCANPLIVFALALGLSSCTTLARPDPFSATNNDCRQQGDKVRLFGLTADQDLICYRENQPEQAKTLGKIAGLMMDTRLVGIDVRPATGDLYGLGEKGGVYIVDQRTGAVTLRSRPQRGAQRPELRRGLQPDCRPVAYHQRYRPEPAHQRRRRDDHRRQRAQQRRCASSRRRRDTRTTTPTRTRAPRCSTSTCARPARHPGSAERRWPEPRRQARRRHRPGRRRGHLQPDRQRDDCGNKLFAALTVNGRSALYTADPLIGRVRLSGYFPEPVIGIAAPGAESRKPPSSGRELRRSQRDSRPEWSGGWTRSVRAVPYRFLWTPQQLGPVTTRNRIVFSAHLTNYARDGKPTEQHAAYYAARAAGGTGLIITEEHSTHPTDWPYEKLIHGFHRDVIPGYRRITDAVHRHRVPIFAQINHNGGQASSMFTRLPVWAPSPVADPLFREVPKAVTAEPRSTRSSRATRSSPSTAPRAASTASSCSARTRRSCAGSSPRPRTSAPTTTAARSRTGRLILLEIVAAVRGVIGTRRARRAALRRRADRARHDDRRGGARRPIVEATGQVDYINTSIGVATARLFMIEASMHVPPGYALFIPSAIRKAVDLPVIGVGRFKDPLQAERASPKAIATSSASCAARSPTPTSPPRRGRGDRRHPPVPVVQPGVRRADGPQPLARLHREPGAPAARRRLRRRGAEAESAGEAVVVVGAGPGVSRRRSPRRRAGHQVTVFEQEAAAGGQVRMGGVGAEPGRVRRPRAQPARRCRRLGVDHRVRGRRLTWFVERRAPPTTSSSRPEPNRSGRGGSRPTPSTWSDVRDVLTGAAEPIGDVIVVDELGFHQATSVAELLADRGCTVEIVTPGMVVGQDLGITLDMERWWMRATAKGIRQSTDLVPMGLDGRTLTLLHHPTGRHETAHPDWVVLAVPPAPVEWLYLDLRAAGVSVERVGDCVAPRRAHAAVVEGERAGAAL